MKYAPVLLIVFLLLGAVFFVYASKRPKTDTDGPYTASGVAERRGITASGWARARSTGAGRNGSFVISMPISGRTGGPVDSDHFLDGYFNEKVTRSVNTSRTLYANADAWGSDRHSNTWAASIQDTSD